MVLIAQHGILQDVCHYTMQNACTVSLDVLHSYKLVGHDFELEHPLLGFLHRESKAADYRESKYSPV